MCTYVLRDDLFDLKEPAYVVSFQGDMSGFASDLVCDGEVDGWLVVFKNDRRGCLGEA